MCIFHQVYAQVDLHDYCEKPGTHQPGVNNKDACKILKIFKICILERKHHTLSEYEYIGAEGIEFLITKRTNSNEIDCEKAKYHIKELSCDDTTSDRGLANCYLVCSNQVRGIKKYTLAFCKGNEYGFDIDNYSITNGNFYRTLSFHVENCEIKESLKTKGSKPAFDILFAIIVNKNQKRMHGIRGQY